MTKIILLTHQIRTQVIFGATEKAVRKRADELALLGWVMDDTIYTHITKSDKTIYAAALISSVVPSIAGATTVVRPTILTPAGTK